MTKILIASTLLLASISQADVIKCSFSEPSIETIYSMNQSTLTYKDLASEAKATLIKDVSFQIKSAGVFELVKNGKVLQTLTLNKQGSDGASDTIYPYEVKDNSSIMAANGGYGGCISNHLKSK